MADSVRPHRWQGICFGIGLLIFTTFNLLNFQNQRRDLSTDTPYWKPPGKHNFLALCCIFAPVCSLYFDLSLNLPLIDFCGQMSLMDYSPWVCTELDTTEQLNTTNDRKAFSDNCSRLGQGR